jgi:hypothetical protein
VIKGIYKSAQILSLSLKMLYWFRNQDEFWRQDWWRITNLHIFQFKIWMLQPLVFVTWWHLWYSKQLKLFQRHFRCFLVYFKMKGSMKWAKNIGFISKDLQDNLKTLFQFWPLHDQRVLIQIPIFLNLKFHRCMKILTLTTI